MSWTEAIFLALIQGLTEFLPISSSAHLILPSQILGWADQGLAFDVAVHVGTLLAVMLYFRHDIGRLFTGWLASLSGQHSEQSRLAWLIVLATVPAGLSGVLCNDFIETHLRSTVVIASTTILFALLLWYADRATARERALAEMTLYAALVIGISQALALIPGTSRSGITMTAALLLGFSRDASARFSFLLSIPIILAAGGLKSVELIQTGSDGHLLMVLVGTLVSFLSAYACIHWFLKVLERIGFMPFVIYRLVLGSVLFGLLALG
jgi:undecaprenyl-diphosphatase